MTRQSSLITANLMSAAFIAMLMFIGLPSASAQTETVIHTFQSSNKHDGIEPFSGVIADSNGALYGTTEGGGAYNYGAVYKLTPPSVAGGSWKEAIIYSFTGNLAGSYPQGNLLFHGGAIYGTLQLGGSGVAGVVYQLTHSGGTWTEKVIYNFTGGSDGKWPVTGLVADNKGNLYGTTIEGGNFTGNSAGYGVVFRLSPPQGANGWMETVLHAFTGTDGDDPNSVLIRDSSGVLYGATYQSGQYGYGNIFKLAPPSGGGSLITTILYSFQNASDGGYPTAGPVLDSSGALYGSTSDGGQYNRGTVYKLTPPSGGSGPWTESTLYAFQNGNDGGYPYASLIFDSSGNLYGTALAGGTGGYGVVFELVPPSGGNGPWTETVLHAFTSNPDGGSSYTPLLLLGTTLYGTTWGGGLSSGTVFEITP
jgi:uncharacterized repeat protein (TIGR03803 family)